MRDALYHLERSKPASLQAQIREILIEAIRVGQLKPGENRYVASADGNSAYPIGHPAALLIRADLATFYATQQDAERAGKTIVE